MTEPAKRPACAEWSLPPPGTTHEQWNAHLCAFCGRRADTVLDHDHDTGLESGYICRQCNRSESISHGEDHPLFEAWAAWRAGCNPAALLGQQLDYSGFGWRDGVNSFERAFPEPTEADMLRAAEVVFRHPSD